MGVGAVVSKMRFFVLLIGMTGGALISNLWSRFFELIIPPRV